MTTETTAATPAATAEEKIDQLRELFAGAPEVGRTALEKVLSRPPRVLTWSTASGCAGN